MGLRHSSEANPEDADGDCCVPRARSEADEAPPRLVLERGPTLVRAVEEANAQHDAEVEAKVTSVVEEAVAFAGEDGHTTQEVLENTKILILGLRELFEGRIKQLEAEALKSARTIASMELRQRQELEALQKEHDQLHADHQTELHSIRDDRDFHKSRSRSFEAQLEQLQGNKRIANEQNEDLKNKQAAFAQHNARLVAEHLKQEEELHQLYGSQIEDLTSVHEQQLREAKEHAEVHRSRSESLRIQMEQLHGNHHHTNKKNEELLQQFRSMQELHDSHVGRVQELEAEIMKIRSDPHAATRDGLRTASEQIHDLQDEVDAHRRCAQLEEDIQRLQTAHEAAVRDGSVNEVEYQQRVAELEAKHQQSTHELEQTLEKNLKLEQAVVTLQEAHATHVGAVANEQEKAAVHAQRVHELEADMAKYAAKHDELQQQAIAEATEKQQMLQRVADLEQQLASAFASASAGQAGANSVEAMSLRIAQLEQELDKATAAATAGEAYAAKVTQLKAQLEQTRAAATEGEAQGELASQLQVQMADLSAENEELKARMAAAEDTIAAAQAAAAEAKATVADGAEAKITEVQMAELLAQNEELKARLVAAEDTAAAANAKAVVADGAEAKMEAFDEDADLKAEIVVDSLSPSTPKPAAKTPSTQSQTGGPQRTANLVRPQGTPVNRGAGLKTITPTTPGGTMKVRSTTSATTTPIQRVTTPVPAAGTQNIQSTGVLRVPRTQTNPVSRPAAANTGLRQPVAAPSAAASVRPGLARALAAPSAAASVRPGSFAMTSTKTMPLRTAGPAGRPYTASTPPQYAQQLRQQQQQQRR